MQLLRLNPVDNSPAPMGRPRVNAEGEKVTARFREGTLARIKSALQEGERQADFIREAIYEKLHRREIGDD